MSNNNLLTIIEENDDLIKEIDILYDDLYEHYKQLYSDNFKNDKTLKKYKITTINIIQELITKKIFVISKIANHNKIYNNEERYFFSYGTERIV